jgi:hypothetical protein
MGPGNISREMLKNPPRNKKTKNSVQKWPPIKDTKSKIVQKRFQVTTPGKWG